MPQAGAEIFTKNFLLLFMAHLFFGFSFWPFVLLPVHLQMLGADPVEIGLIMGSASLAGILSRPFVGIALDRVGRKRCLLFGCLVVVLASLAYGFVEGIGGAIYAVRLFHGLGMGMLMATFFTLAADLSPPAKRTQGIAFFGISGHLSGVIGVPLGEQVLKLSGFNALFVICAGFALVSMMISGAASEALPRDSPRNILQRKSQGSLPNGSSVTTFLRLALMKKNAVPLLSTSFFALCVSAYMVFLKPFVRERGPGLVSFFFVAYSLTAVLVRLAGGDWPDRFGLKRLLYPSLFSMSTGLALIPLWPGSAGLLISGVLCGIGHGFIFPILSVLLIRRALEDQRGRCVALFTLFFDLGLFLGAPLWGWVARGQGYSLLFFLAAAIMPLSWGGFIWLDPGPDQEPAS